MTETLILKFLAVVNTIIKSESKGKYGVYDCNIFINETLHRERRFGFYGCVINDRRIKYNVTCPLSYLDGSAVGSLYTSLKNRILAQGKVATMASQSDFERGAPNKRYRLKNGFEAAYRGKCWNLKDLMELDSVTPYISLSTCNQNHSVEFEVQDCVLILCKAVRLAQLIIAARFIEEIPDDSLKPCSCKTYDLMVRGCKCGGI